MDLKGYPYVGIVTLCDGEEIVCEFLMAGFRLFCDDAGVDGENSILGFGLEVGGDFP